MKERPILMSAPMVRAILAGSPPRKLGLKRGEDPLDPMRLVARLASGLKIDEVSGCWLWQRARNHHGYGTITVGGKTHATHCLALRLSGREIPQGLDVLHACDTPSCINPDHLSVGTRSRNMKDCHARGRSRIPSPRFPGESNPAARLSADDVRAIRVRLRDGQSQAAIARAFGVSQGQISNIARGRRWKEVA